MENKISRRSVLLSGAAALLAVNSESGALAADKKPFDELDHETFMRLAIQQAQKVPECPFGAVVINIKTKKVMAEG